MAQPPPRTGVNVHLVATGDNGVHRIAIDEALVSILRTDAGVTIAIASAPNGTTIEAIDYDEVDRCRECGCVKGAM